MVTPVQWLARARAYRLQAIAAFRNGDVQRSRFYRREAARVRRIAHYLQSES